MRGAAVAAALLMMTVSGCLGDEPETQSGDDGAGRSCSVSVNATSASATCTSSGTSTRGTSTNQTSSTGTNAGNTTTGASGNGTAGNSTVGGNATGNATGNSTAPSAAPQSYSCTVDVGTTGFTFEGAPGAGNMGYCAYVLLEGPVVLTSEDNPSGCSTYVDTTPSDSSGGSAATVGEAYAAGSELGLRCTLPGGALGGDGTIVVTPA